MQNGEGDLELEFANAQDLDACLKKSMEAFKRSFDSEEHTCQICYRSLLGDKFTFLTSCKHFFSTECLHAMIIEKINSGQIKALKCPVSDCNRPLNDHDIKNVGLDAEMLQKYE